jgi:acyl-CoA thioester hydrolase
LIPHKLEIRFADIDAMGHVNNAVYLTYFEQGRIHYFNQLLGDKMDWNKFGIILARNEIDYLQPIVMKDEIYISAAISEVGNKSFKMKMEVFKKHENQNIVCAQGLVTLVCFDYSAMRSMPIPDTWLTAAGLTR